MFMFVLAVAGIIGLIIMIIVTLAVPLFYSTSPDSLGPDLVKISAGWAISTRASET
jgi:hypothetical protein